MAKSEEQTHAESFMDIAAAIQAYAGSDPDAYAEMIMGMDEVEKFSMITGLIHMILQPKTETE